MLLVYRVMISGASRTATAVVRHDPANGMWHARWEDLDLHELSGGKAWGSSVFEVLSRLKSQLRAADPLAIMELVIARRREEDVAARCRRSLSRESAR